MMVANKNNDIIKCRISTYGWTNKDTYKVPDTGDSTFLLIFVVLTNKIYWHYAGQESAQTDRIIPHSYLY